MANGYGNIVGRRGSALNLAPIQQMRALPARKKPPRVRVRAGRGVPDPGSRAGGGRNPGRPNAEVIAELQALGTRGAQEIQQREQARQEAIETGRMRRQDLIDLGQQVRGESLAQQEAQKRQLEMQEQRDAEQEKRRFRAMAQQGSMLDQRYEELRKEGEIKLQGKELAGLTDMIPGWVPKIDRDTGKPRPVYVREEPSGEPGSGEMVFGYYEEDADGNRVQITSRQGTPVRPNRNTMAQLAQMNELDRRERSGIPGRIRKARTEEAAITETEAKAGRDLAEAQYALAGKPGTRTGIQFTQKDRQKALNDAQKRYIEVEDAIQRAQVSRPEWQQGLPEGDPNTGIGRHQLLILRDQIEQQMHILGRNTGRTALPPPDPRDIHPYPPVQATPAVPAARPRAHNPQTGEIIEWNGTRWAPVQ